MADQESTRVQYTQWLQRGQNIFIPTDNAKTVKKIKAGVYNLRHTEDMGFYVYLKDLKLDELANLKSKEGTEVLESIKTFWARRDKFIEYGFVYKRGILLYGPPGSGKTSIINLLTQELIKKMDGVVFVLQNNKDLRLYRNYIAEVFRLIEPDRPIITVIEDIDGLCSTEESETTLINILDGIEQLDNVIYLATTNYTERLSERILNRPNRFDRRIKIGFPDRTTRKIYFKFKLKPNDFKEQNMKKWLDDTEGLTIAHLGELIKSVIILGNDFDETIDLLKKLKEIPKSFDYNKELERKKLGFSSQETKYDDGDEDDWDFDDDDTIDKVTTKMSHRARKSNKL